MDAMPLLQNYLEMALRDVERSASNLAAKSTSKPGAQCLNLKPVEALLRFSGSEACLVKTLPARFQMQFQAFFFAVKQKGPKMVLCPCRRSHREICTRNRPVSETHFLDDFWWPLSLPGPLFYC